MSHIYLNARLHREWRAICASLVRNLNENRERPLPPIPESSEPPPEEWAELLDILVSFLRHGDIGRNQALSIMLQAQALGVSVHHLYPLLYSLGWNTTPDGRYSLDFPPSYGVPMVYTGGFPLWPRMVATDMPFNAATRRYYPLHEQWLNRVMFDIGSDGLKIVPTRRNVEPPGPPAEAEDSDFTEIPSNTPIHWLTHSREQPDANNQVASTALLTSRFNYALGTRTATEEELDSLFNSVLRVGTWITMEPISAENFFDCFGMSSSYREALDEGLGRAAPSVRPAAEQGAAPSAARPTNVLAPAAAYPRDRSNPSHRPSFRPATIRRTVSTPARPRRNIDGVFTEEALQTAGIHQNGAGNTAQEASWHSLAQEIARGNELTEQILQHRAPVQPQEAPLPPGPTPAPTPEPAPRAYNAALNAFMATLRPTP